MCQIQYECPINIKSKADYYNFKLSCLVLPEITGSLPAIKIDYNKLSQKKVVLADPTFWKPRPIDILIGEDMFWNLLCVGSISLDTNHRVQLYLPI